MKINFRDDVVIGLEDDSPPITFIPLQEPPSFELVRRPLINKLGSEGVDDYLIIYCLFRSCDADGTMEESAKETVLIVLSTETKSARPDLPRLLKKFTDDSLRAAVMSAIANVCYGTIGKSRQSGTSKNPANPTYYERVVPGSSIGVLKEGYSASFGGYLKDRLSGRIFGLANGHNFCRHDANSTNDRKELQEFFPRGTLVEQPSAQDFDYSIKMKKASRDHELGNFSKLAEKRGAFSRTMQDLQASAARYQIEIDALRAIPTRDFARTTQYHELAVVDGECYDYMLLDILPERLGQNTFEDANGFTRIIQNPTTSLQQMSNNESSIHIHGRSTIGGSGTVSGIHLTVHLKRTAQAFRCPYAYRFGHGGDFNNNGDSGSIGLNDEAEGVASVFGSGQIEGQNSLEIAWLMDMGKLIKRFNERWGMDIVVWEPLD